MPTSVHWGNKVITVNQSDLLQTQSTPIEVYQLDINDLRLELNDLLDDPAGMTFPDTHINSPPVTVSGVTLARVLEIINDYTVTFLPDAAWAVDIVGGNSNVADRVNPNNVSVRSSNSAGLQDSASLQAASFNGHVTIDVINGVTGTTFPRGTNKTPVNNISDALAIAATQGLNQVLAVNSFTLSSADVSAGYTFYSERAGTLLTIDPGADVTNCTFENIGITGTLDSNNRFYRCEIVNASSLQATLVDCIITGTLTLAGGLTSLINCSSGIPGSGEPEIDLGGSGSDLIVRDWSGGLELSNSNDSGSNTVLDFDSGKLVIAADVTDGVITVRGVVALLEDNSTGSAVVNDYTLKADTEELLSKVHPVWRIMGLDPSNPMTVTPTSRDAGDVNQVISGDGETTSTVTTT